MSKYDQTGILFIIMKYELNAIFIRGHLFKTWNKY